MLPGVKLLHAILYNNTLLSAALLSTVCYSTHGSMIDAFSYFCLPRRKTGIWVWNWKGLVICFARKQCWRWLRVKPMLVYHSAAPQARKEIVTSGLPVIWESNKKVWVMTNILSKLDCFTFFFHPWNTIGEAQCWTLRTVVVDNVQGHPDNLEKLWTCVPVKLVYLPLNTTRLIQPKEQGVVVWNFKVYCLNCTSSP